MPSWRHSSCSTCCCHPSGWSLREASCGPIAWHWSACGPGAAAAVGAAAAPGGPCHHLCCLVPVTTTKAHMHGMRKPTAQQRRSLLEFAGIEYVVILRLCCLEQSVIDFEARLHDPMHAGATPRNVSSRRQHEPGRRRSWARCARPVATIPHGPSGRTPPQANLGVHLLTPWPLSEHTSIEWGARGARDSENGMMPGGSCPCVPGRR